MGVVRDGRLEFFHGHGLADIASKTPITEDTVFRIASITKTFTAIAVMQLWEQGLVDLDAPANDYLRAYRLIPAKASFRPATVRHLLTHTAGRPRGAAASDVLRPDFGESVSVGQPLPSLAEYYRGGLRLDAEPGTRFTYGDHGFATLGQIVEDVSGKPLDRYFREHIFEPLGMVDTDLVRLRARSSRAWRRDTRSASDGAKAVVDREWVTAGAVVHLLDPEGHGALRRGAPRRRRQRARLRAQAGDARQHVRAALPAGSPAARASGWRSSGSLGGHPPSSTRASSPASTRRSSLLPTTASG